jgi:hypothetical protein
VKAIVRHNETGNVTYVQGKSVARSSNHCCSGDATIHPVCIVEILVTVNCLKILGVPQQVYVAKKKNVSRNHCKVLDASLKQNNILLIQSTSCTIHALTLS